MLEGPLLKTDVKSFNNALQKQNEKYCLLLESKEYKLGVTITRLLDCVLHLKVKSALGYIRSLLVKKSKKKDYFFDKEYQYVGIEDNFFSTERIAVYTSIFGAYDSIKEPLFIPSNIDYYIITDQDVPEDSLWTKMDVDIPDGLSLVEKNRYIKMHPHLYFSQYKYSIYVDGSVNIVADMTPFIWKIGNVGIAVHKHSERSCLYDELQYAIDSYKLTKEQSIKYRDYIQEQGMPRQYGLCECGIIARKHNENICKEIMELWWEEFQKNVKRDQISFPYVLYKKNISINEVCTLGKNIYKNNFFRIDRHC